MVWACHLRSNSTTVVAPFHKFDFTNKCLSATLQLLQPCTAITMGPCQGGAIIMQLALVQLDITLLLGICYCTFVHLDKQKLYKFLKRELLTFNAVCTSELESFGVGRSAFVCYKTTISQLQICAVYTLCVWAVGRRVQQK